MDERSVEKHTPLRPASVAFVMVVIVPMTVALAVAIFLTTIVAVVVFTVMVVAVVVVPMAVALAVAMFLAMIMAVVVFAVVVMAMFLAMTVAVAVIMAVFSEPVIMAMAVVVAQCYHQGNVGNKAEDRGPEHQLCVHGFHVHEAEVRADQQATGHEPDEKHRAECPQYLGLVESVGVSVIRTLPSQAEREERDDHAAQIGEHMRGVRHDGDGPCKDTKHDLD
jgi:hypothetical protein